jgi:hypothetical protein
VSQAGDGLDQAEAVRAKLRAGRALDELRHRELRNMNESEALATIEVLLDLLRYIPAAPVQWSGLVEQQRLFARTRS